MSRKDESQNYNSIPDNKISQPKIMNKIISHKCSLSVDITYNNEKKTMVTKIFKKLKIILKRPEQNKNILRSASPRKKHNKIYTYQKSPIQDKNIVYSNKSINSAKNKTKINKNKKYIINPINIDLSSFEISKDKKTNMNINNICSILSKILNNNIYKYKQVFFNKIKYSKNKVYHKKRINSNNNKNSFSQMLPPVLEYNKDKNFLEEINSDNNTVIYHNKSLTNDDSFEGNITIVSKPEIIKLEDSNSNMELNNNIENNNNDNDENSIVNRNYSYDKKDLKEETSEQKNLIFKELKEELNNNSLNKKIIITHRRNKESLLFSEGKLLSINKSKSNEKQNEENTKTCAKNINSNSNNNSKINKIGFTSRNITNKKGNFFIDSISFEKIEPNNLFDSNKNKGENKIISYLNINNGSRNNTCSDKNDNNYKISYMKNKYTKDCYENTCNSFEETTNVNEYENNPINKNSFDEEKYIFNNSLMKKGNFDTINSKELNNFNKDENVIEKSGELFYPMTDSKDKFDSNDELINKEEECEEIDIKGKSKEYLKYKIEDKSKNIISFLSNEEENNKKEDNSQHKIIKAKMSLDSYINIIKKVSPENNDIKNEDVNDLENKNNNIENKIKMSFSKRSYESFMKKLIDEINITSNDNKDNDNRDKNNDDIFENDINNLEDKIQNLKNSVLYLLVKKHYLNSMEDKLDLIEKNNEKIDQQKNDIYNLFFKIKSNFNNKNCDLRAILDILKQYEIIDKRDIKIAKYNYTKEKNQEKNQEKKESSINYGSLILPFLYIAKFLNTFNV